MIQTQTWTIFVALISAVIGGLGPVYLKKSSDELSFKLKKLIRNKNLVKGGIFYLSSVILFIIALTRGEMSVIYPVGATIYIWASIFSIKLLNEKVRIIQWVGMSVIVLGIIILSFGI